MLHISYVYHWMRHMRFRVKILCLLQTTESEGAPFSQLWVALEHRF